MAPPSGGPSAVAVHIVDSKRPFATSRSCGGTSALRQAPLAALNVMSAAATTTDTTRSWAKLSQPSANPAGMLINAAKRVRSMVIITGRLRRNSTHGPSGTATAAPTASPAAASSDTLGGARMQHEDRDQREGVEREPGSECADGVSRPQPSELPPE